MMLAGIPQTIQRENKMERKKKDNKTHLCSMQISFPLS